MKTATLSVDLLRLDAGTQCRVSINEEAVEDYAELILNSNGEWPLGSIIVFHDGSEYFVADGFHRTLAAHRAKRGSVPCEVHAGTATDARIFGMTANDRHGLRMSRADKRSCVEWLLDQKGKRTQTEVADIAGVSRRTVAMIAADRKPKIVQTSQTSEGVSSSEPSPPKMQTPTAPTATVVCPHCQIDLTANEQFSERIVFGEYMCPECGESFEISASAEETDAGVFGTITIRAIQADDSPADVSAHRDMPPAAAAAIICPLCESDETVWIPKTGGGQFIPSTYTCGECEEPFFVDEAGKVSRVGADGAAGTDRADEPAPEAPAAPTVPYTSEVDDGETFQTTMPPIDLSAGPVDPPDLGDFETMKIGWRLHVQPIWMASDDANQRAMVKFVEDLL